MISYQSIVSAFATTGLAVRGGFVPASADGLPGVRSVVLIGNAGLSMWPAFAAGRRDEPDPLDHWTKRVVDPIAADLGATAVHPNDKPFHPFQRWAQRAEPVHPSPLGILIHPVFGLWHAYRAALLFAEAVDGLLERTNSPSPCDSCVEKPCLTACPVSAFNGKVYNVVACAGHLRSGGPPDCPSLGCRARDACPVAPQHRYMDEQIGFHMAAFVRSRG